MGQSGILRADQLGLQGMAFEGKVSEQSAETDEIYSAIAGFIGSSEVIYLVRKWRPRCVFEVSLS